MAWNRPKERDQGSGVGEEGSGKFPFRGLVAGLIVVIGAAVAAWILWPAGERGEDAAPTTKPSRIREARAARAATNAAASVATTNVDKRSARERSMKDAHGDPHLITDEDGRKWFNGLLLPERSPGQGQFPDGRPIGVRVFFKTYVENVLAEGILLNGGFCASAAAAPPDFGPKFEKEFRETLKTPIVIEETDDEKAREVKEAMIELKQELVERMDKGEKLKDILTEAFELNEKIGRARISYQQIYDEAVERGASAQELADIIDAANKILDDYGATRMNLPITVRKQLDREKGIIHPRLRGEKSK